MNPAHATNWTPGLVMLGVGVVVAIAFALWSRRNHAAVAKGSPLEVLQARYQEQLVQLKGHLASKHQQAAAEWEAEKARLERAAALTLKEIDGKTHDAEKAGARKAKLEAARQASFSGRNPVLTAALVGIAVVGFFVVLGVVLTQESTDRQDGREMTGAVPGANGGPMQNRPPQEDPLAQLRARVARSPDDIEVLAEATAQLIRARAYEEAMDLTAKATVIDPYHVPTRIHRAVLMAAQGQGVVALGELEHLAETYEDGYPGLLFAGALAMEVGDNARALRHLERFKAEAKPSEVPPMLAKVLADLHQMVPDAGR